jgi:hypothetical protein
MFQVSIHYAFLPQHLSLDRQGQFIQVFWGEMMMINIQFHLLA